MAKYIKADGTETEVQPKNGTDFSLEEVRGFVGGWVEIIRISRRWVMAVNEEGLPLNLPLNEKASEKANHPIVGDVLICKPNEFK